MVDCQNFEYKFKRESETGARYWVCRLRDSLGCTATASTIERNDATFIKNVKNTHNHSSKLVEKRVKMAEQEAVENAARNPTLTCRAVMPELANINLSFFICTVVPYTISKYMYNVETL